ISGKGFRRQRLANLARVQSFEDVVDDRAQLLRANLAELAVDGDTASGMNRIAIVVVRRKLVVRILNFEITSPAALPLSVEQNAGALFEDFLQICLVPPVGANLAGLIDGGKLEDPELASLDGIGSGNPHLNLDGCIDIVFEIANLHQVGAILVAHWEV